jgi:hypothetical protein
LADANGAPNPDSPIEQPRTPPVRSVWPIGYIKREAQKRAAKKKEESPADKAMRITATATMWMAIFTFLLFLVTGGTLVILKSQLQEMHGGGIDTHELAIAAGKQADRTKELAESAKASAEAAKSAANTAAESLRQSTQQFRIDQRPWIEIDFGKPTLKVPASDQFSALYTYSFSLKNTGKTTAFEIQSRIPRGAFMAAPSFGDDASRIASDQAMLRKETVFSGASETDKVVLLSKRIPNVLGPGGATVDGPLELYGQELKNGMYYFLTGRIDYSDAFEVRHWTTFCVFVGTSGVLQYCREGNEKDRNSEPSSHQKP